MSDKPSQMTDADMVAACNALHRWLKSQDFNVNESLAVLALTAAGMLGTAAHDQKWPATLVAQMANLMQDAFVGQLSRSLRDGKNLLDKG